MRNINETFEDSEFDKLSEAKKQAAKEAGKEKMTWRELILLKALGPEKGKNDD